MSKRTVKVSDSSIKEIAIKVCDSAFPKGIISRDDFFDIFNKIDTFADFFITFVDDTIAGYAAIYTNNIEEMAYITMIGVQEKYQHNHIGSDLMEACVEIAKKKNMKQIKLEVFNSNNKAIKFYEHWGYVDAGECSFESHYMIKVL